MDSVLIDRRDLREGIGEMVSMAYAMQANTEFPRTMEGEAPLDVVVCLGSGRCLYPTQGAGKRHCPFCRTMPRGFLARENAAELVRQHVAGN